MINKFMNKISNMTVKQWIISMLWLTTFILLIAFVISAATVSKGTTAAWADKPKTFNWPFNLVDPKDLVDGHPKNSLVDAPSIDPHTAKEVKINWNQWLVSDDQFKNYVNYQVDIGKLDRSKVIGNIIDGKGLWSAQASWFEKQTFTASTTYANTLSIIGTLFALGLFSSLGTTVWFAYNKKRGGN